MIETIQTKKTRWVPKRRSAWQRLRTGLLCLLLITSSHPAFALTPLERDLKKIERYLEDNFCEDALKLAKELRNGKDGAENFDVWFGQLQATYCLNDVGTAVEISSEMRQKLRLTQLQEGRVSTFVREKISDSFGELKISYPPGKSGQTDIVISKVGELRNPQLDPYFQVVRKKLADGVEPPLRVYLPFGTYEIDQVERSIEDAQGINFVLGKERLSAWKRTQIGDGQALGFGYLTFSGFTTEPYLVDQPGTSDQVLIDGYRPSYSSTPYLEVSTSHSAAVGSIGMMGIRADLRIRPALDFLGGVKELEGTLLIPSFIALGTSVLIEIPTKVGFSFQAGAGIRLGASSYTTYLAFVDLDSGDATNNVQAAVNLPSYVVGPELKLSAARSIRTGQGGVQFGFEVSADLMFMVPALREGTIKLSSTGQEYNFTLGEDTALWGPTVCGTLFLRTPFF